MREARSAIESVETREGDTELEESAIYAYEKLKLFLCFCRSFMRFIAVQQDEVMDAWLLRINKPSRPAGKTETSG